MADCISPEDLIPLVEQRSIIWDKTSDKFKDKFLKAAAWKEICCVLNPEYDKMEEHEKKDYAKSVTTKWIHIRDAFLRSHKKEKKKLRTGAGVKKSRPYLYKNQLNFLLKMHEPRVRHDSCNERQSISTDSSSDSEVPPEKPAPSAKKKTKTDSLDEKITRFLDSKLNHQENPHISFMKGILPSLASFDDDENLEFQAGVLALIQKIKRKRQDIREYEYDVKIFGT